MGQSLEGGQGVACSDGYTAAATVKDVWGSNGGSAIVSDQPAYYQLQHGTSSQNSWTDEQVAPAGTVTLFPGTSGIRFRNMVAGQVSTVTAALAYAFEPTVVLGASGISAPSVPVSKLISLTSVTGLFSVASTSEAAPNPIVTAPAFTFDGSSTYLLEFSAPQCLPQSATALLVFELVQDSASVGILGYLGGTTAGEQAPVFVRDFFSPAAGSHTFGVAAWMNQPATGTVNGGPGGFGNIVPIFLSLTQT